MEVDEQNDNEGKSTLSTTSKLNSGTVTESNKIIDRERLITGGDRFRYRYDASHKGPYVVYVDSYDVSGIRKYLNGISLSRLLFKLGIEGVSEVIKIGYGRCKVLFKNYTSANAFADNGVLVEHGLTPKIFGHFVSKMGIVFDIPTDISEEEFELTADSPVEILRCIRNYRRTKDSDGKDNKTPTGSMRIIFKGNSIPTEITLGYIKVPIKHYVSFVQCYRCYRYNHYALHCKQNVELCRDCFNKHAKENPCSDIICINCKGNHAPTNKNCPARAKAFAIKKLMTIENLSLKEARNRFAGVFSNRFSILEDYDGDFPPINPEKNKKTVRNNHQDAISSLHQILPYAKAVKINQNRLREEAKARETIKAHNDVLKEHRIVLNYERPAYPPLEQISDTEKSIQSNPLFLSQEPDDNQTLAMDYLTKASQVSSEFMVNVTNNRIDNGSLMKFLNDLRENISMSMNYLDISRINRASSVSGK